MASGSHPTEEPVVPKFDMHTFTSNMTVAEVNSIVDKYGIPFDLHPRVPLSTMTMNKLSADAIDDCLISKRHIIPRLRRYFFLRPRHANSVTIRRIRIKHPYVDYNLS
ncbi:hypothetical protein Tco_0110675 [Tanacetum coccineum]